ncbi:MAG: MerR family DNA-binding transcriptional regulator [Burkholderiaceae bacterium]
MMGSAEAVLAVGELAVRSGVGVSALHFYESRGLIAAQRSAGNQRRYARAALRRVAFIGCGCLSPRACALYNPGDRYAQQGSGAQRMRRTLHAA